MIIFIRVNQHSVSPISVGVDRWRQRQGSRPSSIGSAPLLSHHLFGGSGTNNPPVAAVAGVLLLVPSLVRAAQKGEGSDRLAGNERAKANENRRNRNAHQSSDPRAAAAVRHDVVDALPRPLGSAAANHNHANQRLPRARNAPPAAIGGSLVGMNDDTDQMPSLLPSLMATTAGRSAKARQRHGGADGVDCRHIPRRDARLLAEAKDLMAAPFQVRVSLFLGRGSCANRAYCLSVCLSICSNTFNSCAGTRRSHPQLHEAVIAIAELRSQREPPRR